jgi:hypothetical protein
VGLLLAFAGGSAASKIAFQSTADLARAAPLIVHGSVVRVDEVQLRFPQGEPDSRVVKPVAVATVEIRQIVKGSFAGAEIRVVARPLTLADQAQLASDHEYVLMLEPFDEPGFAPVAGLYQAVHHGVGGSVAGAPSFPLTFYERDAGSGQVRERAFPDVASFIAELRRILASGAGAQP